MNECFFYFFFWIFKQIILSFQIKIVNHKPLFSLFFSQSISSSAILLSRTSWAVKNQHIFAYCDTNRQQLYLDIVSISLYYIYIFTSSLKWITFSCWLFIINGTSTFKIVEFCMKFLEKRKRWSFSKTAVRTIITIYKYTVHNLYNKPWFNRGEKKRTGNE